MDFLEKDLEEIIYLSDKEILSDRGLYLFGKLKRQLKIGNYGIADLIEIKKPFYCIYRQKHIKGIINVIELKNNKIGVSTFFQACNYLKGIRSYLEKRELENYFNYNITLIGRSFDDSSSFCYLGDLFSIDISEIDIDDEVRTSIDLYQYSYDLDGLNLKMITGYNLTDKGF